MNEFLQAWASVDSNDDGRLSQDEFVSFNTKHLSNILKRLGWAPTITEDDSRQIWKAIYNLNMDDSGISLGQYGRYHACMKVYINQWFEEYLDVIFDVLLYGVQQDDELDYSFIKLQLTAASGTLERKLMEKGNVGARNNLGVIEGRAGNTLIAGKAGCKESLDEV